MNKKDPKRWTLADIPYKKTLFAITCLCILLTRICWHGSEFCLHKIKSSLSFRQEWRTSDPEEHLQQAWNQPYTYLGNGAQSYAFVSEDGRYVLKFFKMKHLTPKQWLKVIPFIDHYRTQKLTIREQRLAQTFGAFKMAYDDFKAESGLLYIHLNRSCSLNKQVLLIKDQKQWTVNLDEVPFVLQEKGELIYDRINRLINAEDPIAAQTAIGSVNAFFKERDAKGFADLDTGVSGNYGFVGDRVIQIDIGRLQSKKDLTDQELILSRQAENKFLKWANNFSR